VRDVGRVLGHPYGFVDRIAKLIPMELGVTLERALEQDEELRRQYREQEDVQAIIDLARALEGLARNAGKHAGGVVIAPGALTDYTPLYSEDGTGLVTQLDKDDVEAVGLVKFDFLGLRTLTIIERAQHTINELRARAAEGPIEVAALPMEDEATFALLRRCDTTAVFQLESRGNARPRQRLQPDRFEDIVALVALYRRAAAVGHGRGLHRRKHGERGDRLSASAPRADPRADLRRDPVPGAGDADRAGARRLHARRRRPAAPRAWARRRPRRWPSSAPCSSTARRPRACRSDCATTSST
jgi:DNA polymerase III alpha subunit